ncbi:MAG: FxsB family cyclophane-forming radical SAM/SPASM peptide maturase [Candidatus Saccharibacteria bacterium]
MQEALTSNTNRCEEIVEEEYTALDPSSQFVLKVNSRCNLACNYCYVYEKPDQSWENQPLHMSDEVLEAAVDRIAEHAEANKLERVSACFHGGEPLLAPPSFYERAAQLFYDRVPSSTVVDLSMQTNGVLIRNEYLETFLDHGISVGVSLDGDRRANDLHRTYRNGNSSYDQAVAGINMLRQERYRGLYAGILSVVDYQSDPLTVYESLKALEPPVIDLLLPHGNWVTPPPGIPHLRDVPYDDRPTPYADWLLPIFDRWYKHDQGQVDIRTFRSVIDLLMRKGSSVETIGSGMGDEVTIETDGSYQLVDTLKSSFAGASQIGMSVREQSIQEASTIMRDRAQALGMTTLSKICQVCPIQKVCEGGYVTHRYGSDGTFTHPSVFTADLLRMVGHIRGATMEEMVVRRAQEILVPLFDNESY